MMSLQQISQAVHGKLSGKHSASNVMIKGVCTDTRKDCTDKLFIALIGDNFDAHEFIHQAVANGASAVMVSKSFDASLLEGDAELPSVLVSDTRDAFGNLAAWWRRQFVLPVIGVTGSVGKTTTKEMLGCIFSELGNGLVTEGNLNNEIGVPMTLMRLTEKDLFAVIEMGMNHAGEIERLSGIAKPTIALITKAAEAHLENLGSIEAVAKAKAEIFAGLSEDGIAIINADDQFASYWKQAAKPYSQLTFGIDHPADITASYKATDFGLAMQVQSSHEKFEVNLHALGNHNVENALAAITVAIASNIPAEKIVSGMEKYRPYKGRLNVLNFAELTLIDDTYNANPASMRAAIDVLANYPQSTLIVGDMAELGDVADKAHQQIGEYAQQHGISMVLSCGEYARTVIEKFSGPSCAFNNQDELLDYLKTKALVGAVLVKGSRSAAMENVVEHIKSNINIGASQAC